MIPVEMAELRRQANLAVTRAGLDALRAEILAAAEPCVRLYGAGEASATEEDEIERMVADLMPGARPRVAKATGDEHPGVAVGASRVGGVPDLPAGVAWPREQGKLLSFLAQLDLAMLPGFPGSPLPRAGWLYAFASVRGETAPVTVLYYGGVREKLRRQARPGEREVLADASGQGVYEAVAVTSAELGVSLPAYGTDWWDELGMTEAEERALLRLGDALNTPAAQAGRGTRIGQVLGHMSFPGSTPGRAVEMAGGGGGGGRGTGGEYVSLLELASGGTMAWSESGPLNVLVRRAGVGRAEFAGAFAAVYASQ